MISYIARQDANAGGVQGFASRGLAPEVQTELYGLMTSDPEAGKQRMVEIAAGQGVTLTTEEVRGFLLQMDEEEEFDDIELDAVALAAVAGGQYHQGGC